jgi:hypothetical protein
MALSSTSQSTDLPLLSTLYEPPPKHLISVLGASPKLRQHILYASGHLS